VDGTSVNARRKVGRAVLSAGVLRLFCCIACGVNRHDLGINFCTSLNDCG